MPHHPGETGRQPPPALACRRHRSPRAPGLLASQRPPDPERRSTMKGSRHMKRAGLILGTTLSDARGRRGDQRHPVGRAGSSAADRVRAAHPALGVPRRGRHEDQAQAPPAEGRWSSTSVTRHARSTSSTRCSRARSSPGTAHYGPVIVNIISGSLTYVPGGNVCGRRRTRPARVVRGRGTRSRPHRVQPRLAADGVHRHVLRGTRNGSAADPPQTLVASQARRSPAASRWTRSPPARCPGTTRTRSRPMS